MSSDSPDVVARVDPAQSAAQLSPITPPTSPLPAQAPKSYERTADPDWIAGTGSPTTPAAPKASATLDLVPPPPGPQASQALAPSRTLAAGLPPVQAVVPPPPIHAGDEEFALVYVLRLINRIIRPGTLSPVERAFVAGSKVMFEHLASECQRMLDRRVSDLSQVCTEIPRTLKATRSTPHAEAGPADATPKLAAAAPQLAAATPKTSKCAGAARRNRVAPRPWRDGKTLSRNAELLARSGVVVINGHCRKYSLPAISPS